MSERIWTTQAPAFCWPLSDVVGAQEVDGGMNDSLARHWNVRYVGDAPTLADLDAQVNPSETQKADAAKAAAKALALSTTDPFAIMNRGADRLTMQFVGLLFGWINGEVIPYLNILRARENPPLPPLDPLPTTTWEALIPAHQAMIDAETDPTQAITPE